MYHLYDQYSSVVIIITFEGTYTNIQLIFNPGSQHLNHYKYIYTMIAG